MNSRKIISLILSLLMIFTTQILKVVADTVSDANNSLEVATPIQLNVPITDNIGDYYDVDFFKFTTTKNGSIDVSFSHMKLPGVENYLWVISLVNELGVEFATVYSKGNADDKMTVGLPAGTYYIKVYPYNSYSEMLKVNYNITAAFAEGEFYEKEFNDNIDVPNNLILNQGYRASMQNWEDIDFYSFTTSKNGNIDLSFNHAKLPGVENTLWKITIINELKKEFQTIYSNGNVETVKASVGLPAGTYFVKIEPYNKFDDEYYVGVSYLLTVNFTESEYFEKEFNDNIDVPNAIELNKTYSGILQHDYDSDYYSFTTKKNGNAALKFNHPKLNGVDSNVWKVSLMSDSKYVYQGMYIKGNVENVTLNVGLPAGKYYVLVEPYSSYNSYHVGVSYNITANLTESEYYEKESNDNVDVANKMEMGKAYAGVLQYENDTDIYTFTSPINGVMALTFTHDKIAGNGDNAWRIEVLDASGRLRTAVFPVGNGNTEVFPLDAVKGTYYIKITSYYPWSNIGVLANYTIKAVPNIYMPSNLTKIISKAYFIDSKGLKINNVTKNTSVATFLKGITPSIGATMKVYNSTGKTEIKSGYITTGMKLVITAEDKKTKTTYTINLKK